MKRGRRTHDPIQSSGLQRVWARARGSAIVIGLGMLLVSGNWSRVRGAYVWIKDTAHDTSTWPIGFPEVPQPALASDVDRINGSAESSSDTDFDAVMRKKASPFTTVYLGPGLFKTRGTVGNIFAQSDSPGFRLQNHSRLIGSGKGGYSQKGTTVLLVACNEFYGGLVIGSNEFDYWDSDLGEFQYTTASDLWVTDLEVDCNAPELTKIPGSNPPVFDSVHSWHIQGVQLWGTSACHIERVHVKNAIGADIIPPITENFILCINCPPGASTGNLIKDCSVTDFYNPNGEGFCSAISLNRWDENAGSIQGIISGCEVVLNGERGWGYGGEFAYNASSAWWLVITNCVAKGAQRAFNDDTFPNYFVSFAGNNFDMPPGICYGLALFKANTWSRFYNNTITLKGPGSAGFLIDKAERGDNNMILDHNTIVLSGGNWTDASWPFNLNDSYRPDLIPSNIHLEKNKVVNTGAASRAVCLVPPSVGYMSGNTINGNSSLWPVTQPHLGWTYTSSRADMLNDGAVDIILQDSAEHVYSYSMPGAAARSPTTTTPSRALQAGWRVVGSGDINVDGQADLFLNHPDLGLGYWLLNASVCVEAGPITYQGQPCLLGGTWQVVGVADFDGDGKPDLLLQDENTYLGIWHLNGTEVVDMSLLSRDYSGGFPGLKGGISAGASEGKWRVVGTGDFDNNGKPDILFQYDLESDPQTDGQLAVWLMDDVTVVGTSMLDPVRPMDLKNRVVATGDFSRSSSVDIIFQHKEPRLGSGGALTLWSMNPTNRTLRLAETAVSSANPLDAGARNVVGPR